MSNKKDNKEITNISQYLEKINKYEIYIPIFRGQANKDWKIKSTFNRRAEATKRAEDVAILFDQYHRDLINDIKHHRYSQEKDLNDLEILAEIQHFGGATGLIDFSKNALVALFFACQPHKEKDGKVFIMDTISLDEKLVSPKKDDDEIKKILEDIKHKTLYIENIYKSNNRIFAQQGVFLFGEEIDSPQEIIIKKENKKDILKELDKIYGINNDFLFQDIHGFSTINNTNYPIVKTFKEIVRYIRSWKNIDEIKKIQPLIMEFDDREKVACYFLSANAKYNLGQHKEAIEDYDEAIKLNPKFAEAYNNRGIAKGKLGQYEEAIEQHKEAIEDFKEAIKLNPKYADAYNNRGSAKGNLGQHKEAIEDYDEAIKLNPKFAEAYNNRGFAKGNLGQHKEAIEDFKEAIKLNPKFAEAYSNRGIAKGNLGQYEKAIKDFKEAIKLNPEYALAYNNRGFAKDKLGQHKEAIEDYDEAIKLNPKFAIAYNNRGFAKDNLGQHKEAIEDFDEAIKLNPKFAATYNNRGNAKSDLGQYEKAIEDFDEALELFKQQNNQKGIRYCEERIKDCEKKLRKRNEE